MQQKRTELSELGEFGLIDRIKKAVPRRHKSTLLGIGDDAAVLTLENNILITTDMLLEGIHFDLSYVPLIHLGYKAIAVNVSDIAAMNGIPSQLTVSLGVSNRFSAEAVDELYKGIFAACEAYGTDLAGGDTTSSASGLVISVCAVGSTRQQHAVTRSGAKNGDILCVSGDLGAAYLGLQILEREKQVFMANPGMQPQLDPYRYIVQRQLKPEARMDIVHDLAELEVVPTAMIDISDGLGSELLHIAKASGVGMQIYEDKLPVDKQTYDTGFELGIDSTTAAINGGEDYELLLAVSPGDYEKIKHHADIHTIGYVQEASLGCKMVTRQGNTIDITAQGWNHLK